MYESALRVRLNPEDLAAYSRDGVVCLRERFDHGWVDLLREATERCIASPGPHAVIGNRTEPGFFFGDQDM